MAKKAADFKPVSVMPHNDSLLLALFVAAILHVLVILGVNFTAPKTEKFNRAIDITLVNTPAKKPPPEAKFLAPDNQIGAGETVQRAAPPQQHLPSEGESEKKLIKKAAVVENKPKAVEKVLVQPKAAQKVTTQTKADEGDNDTPSPRLDMETLRSQMAQLGTEVRLSQQSSDNNKTKRVSQVSTHQFLAAQYQKDWENKVERIGNMNYPEVAARKNFSGRLTMDVGVRADGSIQSIVITRSSGHPSLDEAAKNIVKMSAPFAPFPTELLKEANVLVITRVWQFSDQSGLSAH